MDIAAIQNISIADYDYSLPDSRIAKFPLARRDASKLLVCRNGSISEAQFSDIAQYLPAGSLLVFNDTRVIQARMHFQKESGSKVEIFCLEPWQEALSSAFEERVSVCWKCLVGNNRRWKAPFLQRELQTGGRRVVLRAERLQAISGAWVIRFTWDGGVSFAEILEAAGEMPLPPYLHRQAEESDKVRYQTVYAHCNGSVAAPTAGLHFTEKVLADVRQAGVETEFVTLHVGAGTFKPVSSERIGGHEMHTERLLLTKEQLLHLQRHAGRPFIAVGTTTVRTVESLYWFGVQLLRHEPVDGMHIHQWYPYQVEGVLPSATEALSCVLEFMDRRNLICLEGETQLMIAPSYHYHLVNGMVTNFHQPKSTLLLLVSAFVGDRWKTVYQYALEHDFRFLSYGDSCLFLP